MVEFLLIASDFPVNEVYERIGLEGECECMNEQKFQTLSSGIHMRNKECSITYSTGYIKTIDIEEPIEQIVSLLHSREEQIIKCIKDYQLTPKFCIVINLTDNPIIKLHKKFIDMASRLQADIEFDSYI